MEIRNQQQLKVNKRKSNGNSQPTKWNETLNGAKVETSSFLEVPFGCGQTERNILGAN
jgi:hypothetical protein